jgi:L-2-hydroxyglutarate oxidase LhgO
LKAHCCVAGRRRLYAYCRDHGVPHAQIGKLIVATEENEIAGVERIAEAARANGVDDLQWLTATQAQRLEPALRCVAALLSPSTGIIDSHALMLAFQGEAEAAGAMVVLRTPVLCGRVRHDGFDLSIGGEEPSDIRCRVLVNAGGSTRPLSPTPSGEYHRRRSRPRSFAGASILPSPGAPRFAGSSTPSRHPAGSASISPSILRVRRGSGRM